LFSCSQVVNQIEYDRVWGIDYSVSRDGISGWEKQRNQEEKDENNKNDLQG
jgi:hypothetical protein